MLVGCIHPIKIIVTFKESGSAFLVIFFPIFFPIKLFKTPLHNTLKISVSKDSFLIDTRGGYILYSETLLQKDEFL